MTQDRRSGRRVTDGTIALGTCTRSPRPYAVVRHHYLFFFEMRYVSAAFKLATTIDDVSYGVGQVSALRLTQKLMVIPSP
jgi:hypothetical protein